MRACACKVRRLLSHRRDGQSRRGSRREPRPRADPRVRRAAMHDVRRRAAAATAQESVGEEAARRTHRRASRSWRARAARPAARPPIARTVSSYGRWTGAFSAWDSKRWTDARKKELNYDQLGAMQNDNGAASRVLWREGGARVLDRGATTAATRRVGIFYIDYGSLLKYFDGVFMNWNPQAPPPPPPRATARAERSFNARRRSSSVTTRRRTANGPSARRPRPTTSPHSVVTRNTL